MPSKRSPAAKQGKDVTRDVARYLKAATRVSERMQFGSRRYDADIDELEHLVHLAMQLDPGCFDAVALLASTRHREGASNHDQTIAIYERAIRIDGDRGASHFWSGYAEELMAVRRLDEAKAALDRALAFDEPWVTAKDLKKRLDRLLRERADRPAFDLDAVLAKRVADPAARRRVKEIYTQHQAGFTVARGGADLARWSSHETSDLLVLGDAVAESIVFEGVGDASARYLLILGDLRVRNVFVPRWSDTYVLVTGDLRVEELLVCNDTLAVAGDLRARVVVNDTGSKDASDNLRLFGEIEVGQRFGFVEPKRSRPAPTAPLVTCEFEDVFDRKVLKEIDPKMRAETLNSPRTRANLGRVEFGEALDFDAIAKRLLAGKPVLRGRSAREPLSAPPPPGSPPARTPRPRRGTAPAAAPPPATTARPAARTRPARPAPRRARPRAPAPRGG